MQKKKKRIFYSDIIDKSQKQGYIMYQNLNISKNDCDEDGRIEDPGESCRLVRGNGEAFQ